MVVVDVAVEAMAAVVVISVDKTDISPASVPTPAVAAEALVEAVEDVINADKRDTLPESVRLEAEVVVAVVVISADKKDTSPESVRLVAEAVVAGVVISVEKRDISLASVRTVVAEDLVVAEAFGASKNMSIHMRF